MKKHIEAEKGELIIVSDEGHRAIIPAKDRKHFLDSLNGCDNCINKYIQQLPMMSNYAEDGSLVPDDGDPIKKETYEQWGDRIRKMSPNLDYTKDGDYNYRGAYDAGLEPVEVDNNGVKEYHLGSRNPKTGEILKYRSHPTFNQAISEDVKMGYVPYEKDGRIYTVDRKSKEYKDLYDSGKLLGYDRVNDLYIAPDLGGATIKATKPQWMKDKEALEKEYSKDWYIDNILPKFSRSIGVSADNMHSNSVKQYNEFINNKLAEKLLKRNPKVGSSNNERLAWYNSLSEKERDIVNNSYSADKFSPAVRAYMESQSNEAKKYGILETFRDVDKLAQSVEGTPERFRIFPNAENNYENYVNPLMWIGDMAKGLGNVPKDIKEENYLKAAVSVSSPLLGGALVGLGAKTTGQFVKNTFLPLGGLEENIVKWGKNLVVDGLAGKLSKADKVIDATKAGSKVLNKTDDVVKPIVSFVDDVGKQASKQWQLEELPGLHLKSTMEGQAISKIIEPKTGLINVEQALGIIGKESGGANKVSLIRQGLGENIPKKMDYNEFRKVIQDQLIPLEKQFATHSSGYGIDRLGYGKYKTIINERGNPILQPLKGKNLEPLENQTLILGNKGKFGRGSSAHGNPEETLGHIHFLRDAETPDVLTVTQIQSDAFQGTHKIDMTQNSQYLSNLKELESYSKLEYNRFLDYNEELFKNAELLVRSDGSKHYRLMDNNSGEMVDFLSEVEFLKGPKTYSSKNFNTKNYSDEISNISQKQLLSKNHPERYLQELVDYAGKRGDINKIRMPTPETAAKIQGYTHTIHGKYSSKHETILKRYSDYGLSVGKDGKKKRGVIEDLFGVEPKIVTDSKGNTWYEFDIPKKFKEGKGEIKAFQVIPPAIGSALYLQSQNKNKSKQ